MTRTADSTYADTTGRLLTLMAYADAHVAMCAPDLAAAIGVSRASLYRLLGVLRDAYGAELQSTQGLYWVKDWGVLDKEKIIRRYSIQPRSRKRSSTSA